jgi:hypothetical protein
MARRSGDKPGTFITGGDNRVRSSDEDAATRARLRPGADNPQNDLR